MKTTKQVNAYQNLKGHTFWLDGLPEDERKLIADLQSKAKRAKEWATYSNFWMSRVSEYYEQQGLSRSQIMKTAGYRIGQDLASRMGIKQGWMRHPDYRDELESIIHQRFKTRREFCEATGLSEDMVSHVLAKRKHLAVNTLEESLRRIGYTLHIAPAAQG